MRLKDRFLDDFDDFENFDDIGSFSYERSATLSKMLDEHRREERSKGRDDRNFDKARRRKREEWYWDDDDDYYYSEISSNYY